MSEEPLPRNPKLREEIESCREYMAKHGPRIATSTQMEEPHALPKCEPVKRAMTLEEHDRFDR